MRSLLWNVRWYLGMTSTLLVITWMVLSFLHGRLDQVEEDWHTYLRQEGKDMLTRTLTEYDAVFKSEFQHIFNRMESLQWVLNTPEVERNVWVRETLRTLQQNAER